MGAIQVKNVPPELHEELRRRAAEEGIDLQDYLLRVLRNDVSVPTQRQWLARLRQQPQATGLPPAAEILDETRADRR